MSGTSKAIVSICVLLLASLVVFYGMTPPQSSIAQPTASQKSRPTMFGDEGELHKLVSLGFPPVAADLTSESMQDIPLRDSTVGTVETVEIGVEVAPTNESEERMLEPQKIIAKETKLYTVREGETLGEIASRELGSYRMWVAIANLNDIADPSTIMPGRTLRMPEPKMKPQEPTVSSLPEVLGKNTHRVVSGETLSSIAIDYYNEANKYSLIVAANPWIDPDRLQIGDLLVIPAN
ncbi:MAG: LysM peptidoglycan-binding domain-containing protein [Planctomycetes bacterium]|nr:LysM peptidoglycan-binding domain-containing protein [Planctomycetota bacterium]